MKTKVEGNSLFRLLLGLEIAVIRREGKKCCRAGQKIFFNWIRWRFFVVDSFRIAVGRFISAFCGGKFSPFPYDMLLMCVDLEKAILNYSFRLVVCPKKKRFHDSIVAQLELKITTFSRDRLNRSCFSLQVIGFGWYGRISMPMGDAHGHFAAKLYNSKIYIDRRRLHTL